MRCGDQWRATAKSKFATHECQPLVPENMWTQTLWLVAKTVDNRFPIVTIGYFTKWCEFAPIPNQEAFTVAKALLDQLVARHKISSILNAVWLAGMTVDS